MSYRGQLTLYKNIFETEISVSQGPSLRERKIECLIDYYYYIGRKSKLGYNSLLQEVSEVFFLSSFTIHDIIQGNLDDLHRLKEEWKNRELINLQKHLQKKWPHLMW